MFNKLVKKAATEIKEKLNNGEVSLEEIEKIINDTFEELHSLIKECNNDAIYINSDNFFRLRRLRINLKRAIEGNYEK